MLVMPADHIIADLDQFRRSVNQAKALAKEGSLVTFGIVPQNPETGYGYIKAGPAIGSFGFDVADFKEKPDFEKAQKYINSGGYYWNGSIFVFKASEYLNELKRFEPEVFDAAQKAILESRPDLDFVRVNLEAFSQAHLFRLITL